MNEEKPRPASFDQVPIEQSLAARRQFLTSVQENQSKDVIVAAWTEFFTALQNEADEKFLRPDPDLDLWFFLQLIKAFIDAEMWDDAFENLDQAHYIADQYQRGQDVFEEIEQKLRTLPK